MKKGIITAVVVLSMLGISSMSFARLDRKQGGIAYFIVAGQIVSVDKSKHSFSVKDGEDGRTYHFTASQSDIESLMEGSSVRVTARDPGVVVRIDR